MDGNSDILWLPECIWIQVEYVYVVAYSTYTLWFRCFEEMFNGI